MKSLSYISLFIALLAYCALHGQTPAKHLLVLQAAELSISGSTNVNTFNCSLRKTNMADTLTMYAPSKTGLNDLKGIEILFKVDDFACDLSLMTNDFRKLLKNDLHPQIIMRIDELHYKDGKVHSTAGEVIAAVTLTIAGQRGRELIRKASVHKIKEKIILTGSHQVLMTTFKIEPPSRLFGTVKARDLLVIDFAIQLQ